MTLLQKQQRPNLSLRIKIPITWTEFGIDMLIVFGVFLGTFKRYLPQYDSLVSLIFDFLSFGLLFYVLWRRLSQNRFKIGTSLSVPPLTSIVVSFCLFSFLTIFFSQYTTITMGIFGWRFLSSGLLLYFLGYYGFEKIGHIYRVMHVFWIMGGVVALYGIYQLFFGYSAIELQWIANLSATMKIAGTGQYRLMSVMGSAQDLGSYLAICMSSLLAYLLFVDSSSRFYRLIWCLMLIVLLFAFVRAAWIAVFLSSIYIWTRRIWNHPQIRMIFPSIIVGIGIAIASLSFLASAIAPHLGNPALSERVLSLSNPFVDGSMVDRYEKWRRIWDIILENPMGIGVGTTGATSIKFADQSKLGFVNTDNSYLKILVETGWIGLMLFLILIIRVFRYQGFVAKYLSNKADLALVPILTSVVLSYVVIMLFGEYIEINPSRTIVWIFVGFLCSLPRLTPRTVIYR